ncbi:MAG: hypothetical protein NC122_06990 [Faecalibacterium sp.]|nr:hypothetical protein [Ruminococcus sp.]MCM1392276.1 hypothetical protein [Ruminococcus sp.]MCM1485936.1 hypothetical protein [Faecalibacterium sp.]
MNNRRCAYCGNETLYRNKDGFCAQCEVEHRTVKNDDEKKSQKMNVIKIDKTSKACIVAVEDEDGNAEIRVNGETVDVLALLIRTAQGICDNRKIPIQFIAKALCDVPKSADKGNC